MAFICFTEIRWPEDATTLFQTSVRDVYAWRDRSIADEAAPRSSTGASPRVPASLNTSKPPPDCGCRSRCRTHRTQYLGHDAADPREETRVLSATRARQLMGLPSDVTVYDHRARAIVKFYIYSGARLAAGCRLRVEDFQKDQDGATIGIAERGVRRRTIGLHFAAAE
jgi:integrase